MGLDQRLIGFWESTEHPKGSYFEISPSGKYFIHERFFSYSITEDGRTLSFQYPQETAIFTREGDTSSSLIGRWSRFHEEKQIKETVIYREDGSYVGFWDDEGGDGYFFGFYVELAGKIKTAEFRADVSTEGDIFTSKTAWNEFSHGYIFEDENTCKFFDLSTNQLAFTFTRKS